MIILEALAHLACVQRRRCYSSRLALRFFSKERVMDVRIDTSGLFQRHPFHAEQVEGKEPQTALARGLVGLIRHRGPITVHEYMSQALNNAKHGYYQTSDAKIGSAGDFITAPEISQLFGELVGIWCVAVWEALGSPKAVQLVELGPGKGTLMQDILRTSASFPNFKKSLQVHMVEMSQEMRLKQKVALRCMGLPVSDENGGESMRSSAGINVHWHSFFSEVPKKCPTIVVGQEFIDAFPVHQFEYTEKGWRERLIDIDETSDTPYHFRMTLSPGATPAVKTLLHHKYLELNTDHPFQIGDAVEVNPLGMAVVEDIAARLRSTGGAALFVDYGENFAQGDSLRGFKDHKQVHVLSQVGEVDISADVDFSALARVAQRQGLGVAGPIGQGEFLVRLGLEQRLEKLLSNPDITDTVADIIVKGAERLVLPDQMGSRYKAMVVHSLNLTPPIVGFG